MMIAIRKLTTKVLIMPLSHKLLSAYLLIAMFILGQGGYIKLKAQLAQVLLEFAWQQQQLGFEDRKAWPWADGHPIAKISISEHFPVIILSGVSGSNLAFAPSWLASSTAITQGGNSVIFAHNDTHFNSLKEISIGDLITIESLNQQHSSYQVSEIKVVHETDLSVLAETEQQIITLITCYPFDSSIINSDLRLVVTARLM